MKSSSTSVESSDCIRGFIDVVVPWLLYFIFECLHIPVHLYFWECFVNFWGFSLYTLYSFLFFNWCKWKLNWSIYSYGFNIYYNSVYVCKIYWTTCQIWMRQSKCVTFCSFRRSLVTMLTPKSFWPKMETHCWVQSTSSSAVLRHSWTKRSKTPCLISSSMNSPGR